MAKQQITPELQARIRLKLVKRFITWFLIATILMAFILYNTSGEGPKQFNPLYFTLGCALFYGLPVGLIAYWIEKWTILGYGVETEKKIISIVFTGIAVLTWVADIESTDLTRIVIVLFIVYCIANIVRYRRYQQDLANGTQPKINLARLDGKKPKATPKSVPKPAPETKKSAEPADDDEDL